MIDWFIERMMVLGRGLVLKPVLVTHICTYNSNNIITLQNIDITDSPPPKKNKQTNKQTNNNNKTKQKTKKLHNDPTYPFPPPPPPKPTTTTTNEVTTPANVLTCHYN